MKTPVTEYFDEEEYFRNNYSDYFWDIHRVACRRVWYYMKQARLMDTPFRKAGQIKLLSILDPKKEKGFSSRMLKAAELALNIDIAISVTNGYPYKKASQCEIINRVKDLLMETDSTLADLAVSCNEWYDFSEEICLN